MLVPLSSIVKDVVLDIMDNMVEGLERVLLGMVGVFRTTSSDVAFGSISKRLPQVAKCHLPIVKVEICRDGDNLETRGLCKLRIHAMIFTRSRRDVL